MSIDYAAIAKAGGIGKGEPRKRTKARKDREDAKMKRTNTNLQGRVFGRLTVLAPVHRPSRTFWLCKCECGKTKEIVTKSLLNGDARSCGCGKVKHGMNGKTEYQIWQGMVRRCYDRKHPNFADYGGRGIGVHTPWRFDVREFYKDVGARPSKEHTLDRIDNNGSYVPGNVRWATWKEQAANRRPARGRKRSTLEGHKVSVREMADYLAIDRKRLQALLVPYVD